MRRILDYPGMKYDVTKILNINNESSRKSIRRSTESIILRNLRIRKTCGLIHGGGSSMLYDFKEVIARLEVIPADRNRFTESRQK
jgi:hypothetical protein